MRMVLLRGDPDQWLSTHDLIGIRLAGTGDQRQIDFVLLGQVRTNVELPLQHTSTCTSGWVRENLARISGRSRSA